MAFYPKNTNIKFNNLPVICDNVAVKRFFCLPPNIIHDNAIKREKEEYNGEEFFNGKATLSVTVSDSEQETLLRDWSYNARMGEYVMWNNVTIRFLITSLHKCEFCVKHKKLYQGHHADWCLLAAKQKAADDCSSDNAISNNATSADSNIMQQENNYTKLTHDNFELQNTSCITVEQNN